jgi:alkylated DNA nucleotide flippase Atl1
MLIATPLLIAEEVSRVARGEVMTFSELRARLAARFSADRTCPLTTGTFAAMVAGAVGEDIAHHRKPRCPIWRLVRDDGSLNTNWPLDSRYRAALLREEGVRVTRTRSTWRALPGASGIKVQT